MLLGIGGAIVAPGILLSGCKPGTAKKESLTDDDIAILDEIGEAIIPETPSSPGAKAAKIGTFMKVYVTDCYPHLDQLIFMDGIEKLKQFSDDKYGKEFLNLSAQEKHDLIALLDKESRTYNKNKKKEDPKHYFSMMKEITLMGYFTSEPGATKAMRYIQTPGYYNGSLPYKKGDRAWA